MDIYKLKFVKTNSMWTNDIYDNNIQAVLELAKQICPYDRSFNWICLDCISEFSYQNKMWNYYYYYYWGMNVNNFKKLVVEVLSWCWWQSWMRKQLYCWWWQESSLSLCLSCWWCSWHKQVLSGAQLSCT